MRKLDKPSETVNDVFLTCISRVADPLLKRQLTGCVNEIEAVSREYERKAPRALLHQIQPSNTINGLSKEEIMKVYTDRMAKKGSPGRVVYDKIITAPKLGICPLCNQRVVSTLDHYLSKSEYLNLLVTPLNLIPACQDCNKGKLAARPNSSEEETIHPYFDDIEDVVWLNAEVIQSSPISLRFSVVKHRTWDNTLFKRVKHHFKVFGLGPLYGAHSAVEFSNIKANLLKLYNAGGKGAVKDYLTDSYDSRKEACLNSWQTSMYSALLSSDWFCDGGFDN